VFLRIFIIVQSKPYSVYGMWFLMQIRTQWTANSMTLMSAATAITQWVKSDGHVITMVNSHFNI